MGKISAFILAGGLGTRLHTVSRTQKVIEEVQGTPFIFHLFRQLLSCKIKDITLGVGYHADEVQKIIGSEWKKLNIQYSVENEPLGTGGAIANAIDKLTSDWIIIMNGDSYFDGDLSSIITKAIKNNNDASIILVKKDNCQDYGRVIFDKKNCEILDFLEKDEDKSPGVINAGIYIVNKSFFEHLPKTKKFSIEKDVFEKIAGTNKLFGLISDAELIDIGTPERLRYAQTLSF